MKLRGLGILMCMMFSLAIYSQAGKDTYQFLNLPSGARQAGYGDYNISIYDHDLNFALANPALLSEKTHNFLGVNYTNRFTDVNIASAVYGRNFGDKNFMAFGINYVDYGKFLETSLSDQILGEFTAKDFVFHIAYARYLSPRWTVGIAMKPIYSVYERYHSFGLAFDVGASYHNEELKFSAGLTLKNAGFQFKGYHSIDGHQHRETLPLDLQLGISQGFKKAPLRFSMTIHNLQRWDLSYQQNDNIIENTGVTPSKTSQFFDMLFRHTIFSVEVFPTKNMYLVVAYNHRRRAEMAVEGKRSAAGFSFGGGLKLYKFHLGVSVVPYQTGNLTYNVTFSTSLSDFGIK